MMTLLQNYYRISRCKNFENWSAFCELTCKKHSRTLFDLPWLIVQLLRHPVGLFIDAHYLRDAT